MNGWEHFFFFSFICLSLSFRFALVAIPILTFKTKNTTKRRRRRKRRKVGGGASDWVWCCKWKRNESFALIQTDKNEGCLLHCLFKFVVIVVSLHTEIGYSISRSWIWFNLKTKSFQLHQFHRISSSRWNVLNLKKEGWEGGGGGGGRTGGKDRLSLVLNRNIYPFISNWYALLVRNRSITFDLVIFMI